MKTAIESWKYCTEKFKKAIRYYRVGNFLTYFITDERCIAHQIDENLIVYKSVESSEIVGIRLLGCKSDLFKDDSMAELKIGDVVALKSGGPSMTVERLDLGTTNGNIATCIWFTKAGGDYGELHTSSFALDALVKIDSVGLLCTDDPVPV